MGRWINKIPSQSIPSKPSKPSFVGFDGGDSGDITELLLRFVQTSCKGMRIDPQLVIEDLLSIEDEQDIIGGHITMEQLNYFIELWVASGMRRVSGKVFS